MLQQSRSNLFGDQSPVTPSSPEKTHASELREDPVLTPKRPQMDSTKKSNGTGESSEHCREERFKYLVFENQQPEVSKEESSSEATVKDCSRERLKRHRIEMAGRVWIPEIWGQEDLLKDWIDCSAFDSSLVPKGLVPARKALVEECQRPNSGSMRIENQC